MLKLKLQYFDHLMQSQLIGKDPDAGKDWRQKVEEAAGDRWLDSITNSMNMMLSKLQEIEGQRRLVCYSLWGCKESDTT